MPVSEQEFIFIRLCVLREVTYCFIGASIIEGVSVCVHRE